MSYFVNLGAFSIMCGGNNQFQDGVTVIHFRIMFGGNNLFVFIDPKEAEKLKKKGKNIPDVTYEFAMSEIGRNAGLDTENGNFWFRSHSYPKIHSNSDATYFV